ncbi:MAG: NifB/NifX family molybdenum-iron cluster-binding protein [Candidatus Thorarchaeota archaeon SMTZ1-45]
MAKICVTASAPDLDAEIDPRFGRCAYFLIVDSETMRFEAISNSSAKAAGGAGIGAAQTVASQGVDAVITGSVGPNAYPALQNANIRILTGASGSVRKAVEDFNRGNLTTLTTPGQSYTAWGGQMGVGGGWGRRGGGGRRGGRGRGRWG